MYRLKHHPSERDPRAESLPRVEKDPSPRVEKDPRVKAQRANKEKDPSLAMNSIEHCAERIVNNDAIFG
jgi:hypothetical protein